jgi:hypothetical protein
MKTFKFIIPSTDSIKVGDIIEYNGVKHQLCEEKEECDYCSLSRLCDKSGKTFCHEIRYTAFKLIVD